MKTYKILINRLNESEFRYLINTEEDLLISHNQNPESGEPFFGSWTDDPELFRKDKNVQILVVEYSLYFPLLLSILDYFIKSNFRRNDH